MVDRRTLLVIGNLLLFAFIYVAFTFFSTGSWLFKKITGIRFGWWEKMIEESTAASSYNTTYVNFAADLESVWPLAIVAITVIMVVLLLAIFFGAFRMYERAYDYGTEEGSK